MFNHQDKHVRQTKVINSQPEHDFELNNARFHLRQINECDSDWIVSMFTNPTIMKNSYDGEPLSTGQAKNKLNVYMQHWQDHGFGFWIMRDAQTDERIGCCGFRYIEDEFSDYHGHVEIGFMIDPEHWGKGLASEAAIHCLRLGFVHYHFTQVMATTSLHNFASRSILEKSGFEALEEIFIYNHVQKLYGLSLADYSAQKLNSVA